MSHTRASAMVLVVLLPALGCSAATAVPPLSELLDKYTQALDATQSMISHYESGTITSGYLPPMNMKHANERIYGRGQRRTDGKGRIYHQACYWGYHFTEKRDVPEERARYSLVVATPDFQYSHNKVTRGVADGALVYKEKRSPGFDNFRDQSDAFFLGYLGNDSRIDINLRNARDSFVRPQTEIINGSACYVIQADTAYGDHTVWLDSTHGFQPARIEISRTGDDIVNVTAHQPPPDKQVESKETLVIDDISFKKIQGVWIPVEGHVSSHVEWPRHGFYFDNEIDFRTTEIVLNPDHDALNSFADPMKNPQLDPELTSGIRVRLGEEALGCVWRGGKVVDKAGRTVNIDTVK